jgi:hypothetical protein
MARLLSSSDEDRKELIGAVKAYEYIYKKFISELASLKNSEE